MINFFVQLLDLVYKKRCYFCKSTKENSVMCSKCYDEIELLSPKPIMSIDEVPVYSAVVYAKHAQKMIRAIKYHNKPELAKFQAKLMSDFWQTVFSKEETYAVLPVPLFKTREKKRKYNHMLLCATEFAALCGYSVKNDLIIRVKDTKPQYKLTIPEREKNLHSAFEAFKENYAGENILIIDDILTTGSTLREIITELKKSGITKITCFTTSCTASHV